MVKRKLLFSRLLVTYNSRDLAPSVRRRPYIGREGDEEFLTNPASGVLLVLSGDHDDLIAGGFVAAELAGSIFIRDINSRMKARGVMVECTRFAHNHSFFSSHLRDSIRIQPTGGRLIVSGVRRSGSVRTFPQWVQDT